MTYNMRHALTGFAQTWKKIDLGPGKLLEFGKKWNCPGML